MRNKILLFALLALSTQRVFAVAPSSSAVSVYTAPLRSTQSFVAPTVEELHYGDIVFIQKRSGSWINVRAKQSTKVGWLHVSQLGRPTAILRDIGKGEAKIQSAYKDDAVTAGKGFSPEYEAAIKKSEPQLNFAKVDELENRKFETNQMNFVHVGGLNAAAWGTSK